MILIYKKRSSANLAEFNKQRTVFLIVLLLYLIFPKLQEFDYSPSLNETALCDRCILIYLLLLMIENGGSILFEKRNIYVSRTIKENKHVINKIKSFFISINRLDIYYLLL